MVLIYGFDIGHPFHLNLDPISRGFIFGVRSRSHLGLEELGLEDLSWRTWGALVDWAVWETKGIVTLEVMTLEIMALGIATLGIATLGSCSFREGDSVAGKLGLKLTVWGLGEVFRAWVKSFMEFSS